MAVTKPIALRRPKKPSKVKIMPDENVKTILLLMFTLNYNPCIIFIVSQKNSLLFVP